MTTDTPTKKAPLLTPLLLVFMLAMILANLGGNMYGPLEALYLKNLGAGIAQIGLFYTLSQIIPLLLQILGGWVSDSLGRLKAIAIGSVAGIFVYIPLLLASRWEWVLVASALGAVTRSLIGPSFDAFIADHSSPGKPRPPVRHHPDPVWRGQRDRPAGWAVSWWKPWISKA